MSSRFEQVGSETTWRGKFFAVEVGRFRHEDGETVEREYVRHSGAVGIVACDDEHVWLVRQPREVTGVGDLLEIPAGKLDVPGEDPADAARRELAEEIGKRAATWRELTSCYISPGFTDERLTLYLATDLRDTDAPAEAEEDERIDVVPWPLADLDAAIVACEDSKTLVGLLMLARLRDAR